MSPEQHAQRVRQIAFMLEKADYGMGMPRDYQRVLELRVMLKQAQDDAEAARWDASFGVWADSDGFNEQAGGY